MIPEERRRQIIALLNEKNIISINDLISRFGVSHMTIRRDIAQMEAEGRVKSVTGGVELAESISFEPSHEFKSAQYREEKEAIGRYAASLIPEQATVYLDAGTSCLEIARAMHGRKDVVAVTNDLAIALYLTQHVGCTIYQAGGRVDNSNQSCVGDKVVSFLEEINIDVAFISSSSWNQNNTSTPSEDKVVVKRAIIRASKQNILVSDSSKYGKVAMFKALDLSEFDQIITDKKFPISCIEDLALRGIRVTTV